MAKSFEELFTEKIDEELRRHTEDLAMGSANDYPEYKEKVGYIRGLITALDIFGDIISRARKENLDD